MCPPVISHASTLHWPISGDSLVEVEVGW